MASEFAAAPVPDALEMLRCEMVAQRAVLSHLVDLITDRGGPDRDTIADQLDCLRLFKPGGDADEGAEYHLSAFTQQLRANGRGNVFRVRGWPQGGR